MLNDEQDRMDSSAYLTHGRADMRTRQAQRRLLLGSVAAFALMLIATPITLEIGDGGPTLSTAIADDDEDDDEDDEDDDEDDEDDDEDDLGDDDDNDTDDVVDDDEGPSDDEDEISSLIGRNDLTGVPRAPVQQHLQNRAERATLVGQ